MRKRYSVSFLSLNYPPEPTGIAPYTGSLAGGLARGGNAVAANVAHPHYPEWTIADDYGQWIRRDQLNGVDVTRRRHFVPRTPRGIRRLLSELSFGLRLALGSWGSSPVIVAVSPSLFATSLAVLRLRLFRQNRRPALIIWVQDLYTLGLSETGEGSGFVQCLTRWVESRTLQSADCVVAIHPRFQRFVVSELGVESSRAVVIRNWTHLARSEPVDVNVARSVLGWPKECTLAVHTGNMGSKQGLQNLVAAARLADEMSLPVHFMLVGDGGERRQLEQMGTGISRLTFVDPLSSELYRYALCAADVLIVNEKPGVSAMAVPSKLTSYFDAGRPVVAATDRDGITASEIVAAQAGVVVPAGDPSAVVDAVLEISGDVERAMEYGRNGRRYRESVLDEGNAIRQWEQLISAVIAEKPSASC